MTEPKKVAFTTLGSAKREKKREKKSKTVRLNLTLAESNEKFCPEFNYRELVSQRLQERLGKKRLGDVINGPSLHPNDPFATDEDAALKALAKQLESKYSSYIPTKKKKRRKENDFSTLGEGYDETDPFIDNSDAFDEVVPVHMETKHRGFYINSGELDFEEVAEEFAEDEESIISEPEVRRKKNRIESDEEDESEEEEEDSSKAERTVYENGIIRPKKRKLDEGELLRKRKKMIGKFNAKNQEKKDSDPESEKVHNGCESKGDVQPSDQRIAASIEAVISKAREEAGDKKSDTQESASGSDSSSSDSDSSGSSSSSDSDSDEDEEEEEEKEVDNEAEADGEDEGEGQDLENGHQYSDNADDLPLPDNLPSDLLLVINKLKEEGHACKGSSQKFFTDSVNKLLLSIVIKLNKLGGRKKTQIYNHLSQHLPCGTQTIVKRSKNLLTDEQENKLREPLKRLQEAIDAQMPILSEQHLLECQRAAETKGESGTLPNEEEEEEGDKKKSKLPKKKFIFTDEIKKCLGEVVRVRVQYWNFIKKRAETPEEHIRAFLDSRVRPLWPRGWMNARILYKESYEEHCVLMSGTRARTTPVKKTVSLGGGSTSIVSSTTSPQPPKPSLTATVIPKNFLSPVSSPPKSEVLKKKSVCHEQKVNVKSNEDEANPSVPVSCSLSIKSVEKINEGADKIKQDAKMVSESNSHKVTAHAAEKTISEGVSVKSSSSVEKTISCTKRDDVNVIDISSDDDKTVVNKLTSKLSPSSSSSDLKKDKTLEKDNATVSSTTPAVQKVTSTTMDGKKDDNLEEEMNMVMNELLQISKQKTADGFPEKLSSPKDNFSSSAISSSASKVDIECLSKDQVQTHQQHSHVTQPQQPDKYPQKQHSSSPSYSSRTSPVKQTLSVQHTSPVQEQKHNQSLVEHKKQHSSPIDSHKHSLQHSSPMQQKQHINTEASSMLQLSSHPTKEVPPSKSMHQSQSHHHQALSLQKTNSQQSLSMQYSSQAQQMKQLPDLSHKSLSNQQYSQPHHQQPAQSKTINVSVSSWNKPETPMNSKHSPESTKKSHTTWPSSSDMSLPRQKQQDNIQVVASSVDPLANLRMMHGLSVSNVKKSSGSSSVYHNPGLVTSATSYNPTSSVKISGSNNSQLSNNVSSSLTPSVTASLSSSQSMGKSTGYSTSQSKHSSSSVSHSSSKNPKHTANPKSRLDPYAGAVSQSMYELTQEQINMYKQHMHQQKQVNHLSSQQQQDLWQQMNASGYLPGMSGMSNTDMLKLMSQINKSVDGYTQSSQSGPYPNPGTPTSVSPHLTPYGDASRGNQHSHHISPHHLHPTHGGSDQHRGQY